MDADITSLGIKQAGPPDLDAAARLFAAYRVFYEQPDDLPEARRFLEGHLAAGTSIILLARDAAGDAVGFLQVFPSFSSVSLGPIWKLNDLFVATGASRMGVADALMDEIERRARAAGVIRLDLETGVENHAAQALYVRRGWRQVTDLKYFEIRCDTGD